MDWVVGGYWALATVVFIVACLLGMQAWEHRRYAWSRARQSHRTAPRGRVALLVPCKGVDVDLENNLRPLFEQDHENYELIFVVESLEDNACAVIRRLFHQYPGHQSQLIVAGLATTCGQKVQNLLAGTEHLRDEIKFLAFVDADVRPPRDWLRLLIQRLDEHGAATGYRRFIPKRRTLANCLLASMDSAVVAIMFPGIHHTVWGGSWAVRREVFERGGFREAWQGTLSDDLVAGRVLARMQERVAFEPMCILPSPLDIDLRTAFSFVRRQFTIGRFYSTRLWRLALAWNCLNQGVFWCSLTAAGWGWCRGASWAWQPTCVTLALYAVQAFRAWLRQEASRAYLPDQQAELAAARQFDIWCGPLAALACCGGLISSALARCIVWKEIQYEMGDQGQVLEIRRARRSKWSEPRDADEGENRRRVVA